MEDGSWFHASDLAYQNEHSPNYVLSHNKDIAVYGNHHTAMGNHERCGITQCYVTLGSGDFPVFTPAEVGTRLSDPGGMQG